VFSAALIKKRRYWPKYIDGDRIKQHFQSKAIGAIDALRGELDEVPFHVFGMKEENYVMMLMSTYGTLSKHEMEPHPVLRVVHRLLQWP
jgi:hypothetical protein